MPAGAAAALHCQCGTLPSGMALGGGLAISSAWETETKLNFTATDRLKPR